VEARFYKIVNENIMLGEDYRSRALKNLESYFK
jgi:predicted RNase H-like nuclease (RuvC/YqgF family)